METQPDVKSLSARVEKLESQNRWMKRSGLSALVLASAVAVMGQAETNKVITANGLRLIDDKGISICYEPSEEGGALRMVSGQRKRQDLHTCRN